MTERTRREHILGVAQDAMSNFLYYNRKEDEDLRVGEIEDAIRSGEVTVDEILAEFRKSIERSVGAT